MKKQFYAPYVLLALALVGIAVAFYDAHQLYNGQALWSPPPINGCDEVANISWGSADTVVGLRAIWIALA